MMTFRRFPRLPRRPLLDGPVTTAGMGAVEESDAYQGPDDLLLPPESLATPATVLPAQFRGKYICPTRPPGGRRSTGRAGRRLRKPPWRRTGTIRGSHGACYRRCAPPTVRTTRACSRMVAVPSTNRPSPPAGSLPATAHCPPAAPSPPPFPRRLPAAIPATADPAEGRNAADAAQPGHGLHLMTSSRDSSLIKLEALARSDFQLDGLRQRQATRSHLRAISARASASPVAPNSPDPAVQFS